jgi:exopolyphosphatase/pppGpp-phosphohydrolase
MAGFSRQEQLFLSVLVGFQRREVPADYANSLPVRMHRALTITLLCMRMAWIFCRTRDDEAIPETRIRLNKNKVGLCLPASWKEIHPLTIADLEFEEQALMTIGMQLNTSYTDHDCT